MPENIFLKNGGQEQFKPLNQRVVELTRDKIKASGLKPEEKEAALALLEDENFIAKATKIWRDEHLAPGLGDDDKLAEGLLIRIKSESESGTEDAA